MRTLARAGRDSALRGKKLSEMRCARKHSSLDPTAAQARRGRAPSGMLKFGKPIFLTKMNKLLAAAGQTPISPPSFYELVSGPEY